VSAPALYCLFDRHPATPAEQTSLLYAGKAGLYHYRESASLNQLTECLSGIKAGLRQRLSDKHRSSSYRSTPLGSWLFA
jgi:hypothetical protein